MQDFAISHIKNCLYVYPDDDTSSSQATSYNMFGGFKASVRDPAEAASLTSATSFIKPGSNYLKLKGYDRTSGNLARTTSLKVTKAKKPFASSA